MKCVIGVVAAILLTMTTDVTRGDTLIYEPFNQTAGKLEGQPTSGIGLQGNWLRSGDSGCSVYSNSLAYGNMPTSGNYVKSDGRRQGNKASIDGTLSSAGVLDHGSELWFSVLHRIGPWAKADVDWGFALANNGFWYSVPSRPYNGSGIGFALRATTNLIAVTYTNGVAVDGTSVDIAPTGTEFGETILIVGKITWGADGNAADTVDLYLPDAKLTKPGPVVATAAQTLDQSILTLVTWGDVPSRSDGFENLDEIRFGEAFFDVNGIGPPRGMVLIMK